MDSQQEMQPEVVFVPGKLMPLVRLVRDMLWDLGYSPINADFLELLCHDLELLAVMQKIAFRLAEREGRSCQE